MSIQDYAMLQELKVEVNYSLLLAYRLVRD